MKTIQKENRVEQINEAAFPEAIKRGWREIDPVTGEPVKAETHVDTAALLLENAQLKQTVADLQAKIEAAEEAKLETAEKAKKKAAKAE